MIEININVQRNLSLGKLALENIRHDSGKPYVAFTVKTDCEAVMIDNIKQLIFVEIITWLTKGFERISFVKIDKVSSNYII